MALKQLVWTANTFVPTEPAKFLEWIEIRLVKGQVKSQPYLFSSKKVVLATMMETGCMYEY